MSEQEQRSPMNEAEQNLYRKSVAILEQAQANMNSLVTALMASRGVSDNVRVKAVEGGTVLAWSGLEQESGGPGNSVEPSAIGLVSDSDGSDEASPEGAAN